MADINARLLQAIDGSAPQHKVRGQNRFEFSEGSDRTLHIKIAGKNGNPLDFEGDKFPVEDKQLQSVINELNKVKSELESIKNGTLKVKNDQLIDKIDALLAKQQSLEDKINSVIQGNAFRTQLTGSYVEYNAAQRNFSITAGASKTIEFIFDRNVEAFVITLYKPQAYTTSKPTYMFRFGTYGAPAFSVELPLLNENTSRGFTSKKIDVLHNRAIMILSNNDTSDQNYSVFVTLFKKSLDGSVTISET